MLPWLVFLSLLFPVLQEPSNKRVKPLSRVTSLANLIPPVRATPLKRFSQTLQVMAAISAAAPSSLPGSRDAHGHPLPNWLRHLGTTRSLSLKLSTLISEKPLLYPDNECFSLTSRKTIAPVAYKNCLLKAYCCFLNLMNRIFHNAFS